MVSTQNTFLPNTGFPHILDPPARGVLDKDKIVSCVFGTSAVSSSTASPQPKKHHDVVDNHSSGPEIVLRGLIYKGRQPKSVADLITMGSNRNKSASTNKGIDETAAFHNDVAYFKVLLEAREKHRAAMQAKLQTLRLLRAKQRKVYRKRTCTRRAAAIVAVNVARAGNDAICNPIEKIRGEEHSGEPLPETVCASPVSSDIESEISSDLGGMAVSNRKPTI